jgi:ABC-type transport system involved in cytochrome bd biosynthesis fused ATPase/permease subunit
LLFDEATNALDIQTEKNVIKEIFLSGEDKTIIFVSHNPENLKYCSSIFEMKNRNLTKLN